MWRELAAAFACVGLSILGFQWLNDWYAGMLPLLLLAAIGVLAYGVGRHALFRFLCAGMVTGILLVLTWQPSNGWMWLEAIIRLDPATVLFYLAAVYWRLWLLTLGAVLCVFLAQRGGKWAALTPMAWALAILVQTLAWLAPSQWAAIDPWASPGAFNTQFLRLAFALLPAFLLGALWRRDPAILSKRVGFGAIVVLLVASFGWLGSPGISLALVWLLLGFSKAGIRFESREQRLDDTSVLRGSEGQGYRSWIVFGAVGLMIYLGRFYFDLNLSLLDKAALLAAMGLWFFVAGWLLRKRIKHSSDLAGGRTWGYLAVGLVVVLALVNTDIYRKESLLADGKTVILELRPLDPRSLMQGDYMALNFRASDEISFILRNAKTQAEAQAIADAGGYMFLRPDADGAHRVVAIASQVEAQPTESTDEVRMRFNMKHGWPDVGVNAFFFTEGEAQRFARAVYGEFRVADNGDYLLARLLDEQQKPL